MESAAYKLSRQKDKLSKASFLATKPPPVRTSKSRTPILPKKSAKMLTPTAKVELMIRHKLQLDPKATLVSEFDANPSKLGCRSCTELEVSSPRPATLSCLFSETASQKMRSLLHNTEDPEPLDCLS